MSFEDLPENWADLPLDTPGLAADVADLVVGEQDRAGGCLGIVLTRADRTMAQPCVVHDVDDSHQPEELRSFLAQLAEMAADAGGAMVFLRGRRGFVYFTDVDRRWHQVVLDACRDGGAPLLGAFLATPGNVRAFPAALLATGTEGG